MDTPSADMRLDPVAQASEFFVEFRVGDVTPAIRARFEKWLRASPEHIQAYLEVAAGWSELPTADPNSRIDVQALLAAARNGGDDNVVQLRSCTGDAGRSSTSHRTWSWAIAVSLALTVALIGVGVWLHTSGTRTYSTGIGEQRTLMLEDGSTVILNALTAVRIHLSNDARSITLIRGQAYFHDMDDAARPFIVHSGKSTVRAIGTEFDVDHEPDRTVVTVLEGQVAVVKSRAWIETIGRRELVRDLAVPTDGLKPVLVSAGEQVTVMAKSVPAPRPVDVGAVTAWMQQRLIFDETPLEEVAEQFNLYSKRRLVIADPSLRSVAVSGVYSAADPAAMIGFLRSQPTLHVVETGETIIVTTRQRR